MLAEWMDVGSVALIGFAVALTLLHLSVRPSRSGGQSETDGQTFCYMGYMGDHVSFGHDHL